MIPPKSIYNLVYCALSYSEFLCQCALRHLGIKASYFFGAGICKFVIARFLSASSWKSISSLFHTIINIVLSGAKKQMSRANTQFVVTFVKNPHAVRDRTYGDNPRCSVRTNRWCATKTCRQLSISQFRSGCSPCPAWTQLLEMYGNWTVWIYLFPKSALKSFGKALRCQVLLSNFDLHSVSSVNCLPRLRLVAQRAGTSFIRFGAVSQL